MASHGLLRDFDDIDIMAEDGCLGIIEDNFGPFVSLGKMELGTGYSATPRGVSVDIVVPNGEWSWTAFDDAVDGKMGNTLSLPWLVFTKLKSGRSKDVDDVEMMLSAMDRIQIKKAKQILKAYEPSLSDDLSSMLAIIRL